MLPLCVLVHVWYSDDDGVCKDGSKMVEGCNVTLIGTGVMPFLRHLYANQLATLPESFGDLRSTLLYSIFSRPVNRF